MIERGAYRSIYCVIVDSPEFQAFSPGAKLVFFMLKLTLGPSGIDVVPALVATLVERTGADTSQVEKGLAQLEAANWVQRERNVVWIVDALRYEPAFSLENQNHRQKIRRHLDGLPKLAIVTRFRAYYGIAAPSVDIPSEIPSSGHTEDTNPPSMNGSHMPSMMASKNPSKIRREGEGEREKGEGETEKGDSAGARRRRGGDGHSGAAGRPTWLTPFAEAWRQANGGTMSAGKAVKALAKLVEQHGADEVLRRWVIYLAAKGEYANAPSFAETWGRWDKPVLRHERTTSSAPPPNAAQVEAGNLVAAIRELVFDQSIPGQGNKRLLRNADVERMGDDIHRAYRTVGGAARFLAIESKPDDLPFLIRAFSDALQLARAESQATA